MITPIKGMLPTMINMTALANDTKPMPKTASSGNLFPDLLQTIRPDQ